MHSARCLFCTLEVEDFDLHMKTCPSRPTRRDCTRCGARFRPWTNFEEKLCGSCHQRNRIKLKACKQCSRKFFGTMRTCGRCKRRCRVCGRINTCTGGLLLGNCPKHVKKAQIKDLLERVTFHATGVRLAGGYSPDREFAHFCPICGVRTLGRSLCRICRPKYIQIIAEGRERQLLTLDHVEALNAALGWPAPGCSWTDFPTDLRGVDYTRTAILEGLHYDP